MILLEDYNKTIRNILQQNCDNEDIGIQDMNNLKQGFLLIERSGSKCTLFLLLKLCPTDFS